MWTARHLFVVAVVATGLLAPYRPAKAQDVRQALSASSMIEEVKRQGVLKVGLSTFVPWAMPSKSGPMIGFEVDVAQKLADDMKVKLQLVPTTWDGIIPALIAKKFDIIIGGMTITPERNLTINFTAPYEHAESYVLVGKKYADKFKSLDDFNNSDVAIANVRGATTAIFAKQAFPKAQQLLFDGENQGLQEVLNGKAQAVMASTPTPSIWMEKYPDALVMPFDKPLYQDSEGMGIRKGDPDALNFLDNWIVVHTDDGWLQERFNYWFKTREWENQVAGSVE
jgi:polar amino acid transport system substrate-binding protein